MKKITCLAFCLLFSLVVVGVGMCEETSKDWLKEFVDVIEQENLGMEVAVAGAVKKGISPVEIITESINRGENAHDVIVAVIANLVDPDLEEICNCASGLKVSIAVIAQSFIDADIDEVEVAQSKCLGEEGLTYLGGGTLLDIPRKREPKPSSASRLQ